MTRKEKQLPYVKMTTEEIEKYIAENSTKELFMLLHWLYKNHKDVLREWEKSKGLNISLEFASTGKEVK